ncbi:MAG: alpha/beta fold hydrolase [Candidatus Hydrogenedentes bacterium]|nr:alpha/beta fold hydrolase [Candidatus Hydrogenedentota bacterium]
MPIRGPVQVLIAMILVLLGAFLGGRAGHPVAGAALSLIAGMALVYTALNTLLFAIAFFGRSPVPPDRRLGFGGAIALYLREWWALVTLYTYYHIPALTRRPAGKWRGGSSGTAVVFVHGFCCNSGFWLPLQREVAIHVPHALYAITLDPLWASIDTSTRQLEALLDSVAEEGNERIILVGHSMGGLVSRSCYQHYAHRDRIVQIITIGSPHHGTRHAHVSPWRNAKQMRPGNAWLAGLNASTWQHPRLTSIYSLHDTVIAPQLSSRLDGAENMELTGIGHMEMSRHTEIQAALLQALKG